MADKDIRPQDDNKDVQSGRPVQLDPEQQSPGRGDQPGKRSGGKRGGKRPGPASGGEQHGVPDPRGDVVQGK